MLGGLLRSGENLFNGIVQIFNTIPILAILPVMIVWFGIGEKPKILIIAFGAFVPIYLNLFAAIRSVDQRLIEMARTTGAGRWRLVTRVMFPGALPGFLVGLRFSLAYSILGLVAAETVNANSGIGFLITNGQTYLQTNQVFVGLVIYSILGLLADQLVRLLRAGAAAVAAQLRGDMSAATVTRPGSRRARSSTRSSAGSVTVSSSITWTWPSPTRSSSCCSAPRGAARPRCCG